MTAAALERWLEEKLAKLLGLRRAAVEHGLLFHQARYASAASFGAVA